MGDIKRRKVGICEQCRVKALLKLKFPLCDKCYSYQTLVANPNRKIIQDKWRSKNPDYFKSPEQKKRMRDYFRKINKTKHKNYRI